MPTPVTPFKKNGEIYEDGVKNLIKFYSEKKVSCLYVLGSYGGFALMNIEERKKIAELYIKYAHQNNIRVIVNISSPSTKEAVELAKHSEFHGADAVSSLVPYYYSGSGYKDKNILMHFKAVIESINLPLYFYNNPRTTGYTLNLNILRSMLDMGLKGMKQGDGNIKQLIDIQNLVSNGKYEFDLIPGQGQTMLTGLLYGANAVMSGTAVFFPEINNELYNAFQNGDLNYAVELHRKIIKISEIQSLFGPRYEACYGILRLRGCNIGEPRMPWNMLSKSQLTTIKEHYIRMNLL